MIPALRDPFRLRAAWAEALCFALGECHPDEAVPICFAYLADRETGGPMSDVFGTLHRDARIWADAAPVHEVAAYTMAGLDRLPQAHLSGRVARTVFRRLWAKFTETDRAAFIAAATRKPS